MSGKESLSSSNDKENGAKKSGIINHSICPMYVSIVTYKVFERSFEIVFF